MKTVTNKSRLKALLYDYLTIWIYLLLLFAIMGIFYGLILKRIPYFTEIQTNLISFGTTVLPISLFFAWQELTSATFGKRKMGLKVAFKKASFGLAWFRNLIKFLPWQLGHVAAIHGMYQGQDLFWMIFQFLSLGFLLLLLWMALGRSDRRHLGDLLAGARVVAVSDQTLR